ncbi:TBC1 domain, member 5 [Sorochytrium milnesiophthora]
MAQSGWCSRWKQLLGVATVPATEFADKCKELIAEPSRDDHPLSTGDNSTWKRWFKVKETENTITQDVHRAFPEMPFFRDAGVQDALARILLVYALEHPALSYRQGMHEVAGAILYFVHEELGGGQLQHPLDERTKEDAHALFRGVMKFLAEWYQFAPADDNKASSEAMPVIQRCHQFFEVHLRVCDEELFQHLRQLEIEPNIFGIRWLRLLFLREFPLHDIPQLWDVIFQDRHDILSAPDHTGRADPLELVDYICAELFTGIRDKYDFGACWTALMKYTSPLTLPEIIARAQASRRKLKPAVDKLIAERSRAPRSMQPAILGPPSSSTDLQVPSKHSASRSYDARNGPPAEHMQQRRRSDAGIANLGDLGRIVKATISHVRQRSESQEALTAMRDMPHSLSANNADSSASTSALDGSRMNMMTLPRRGPPVAAPEPATPSRLSVRMSKTEERLYWQQQAAALLDQHIGRLSAATAAVGSAGSGVGGEQQLLDDLVLLRDVLSDGKDVKELYDRMQALRAAGASRPVVLSTINPGRGFSSMASWSAQQQPTVKLDYDFPTPGLVQGRPAVRPDAFISASPPTKPAATPTVETAAEPSQDAVVIPVKRNARPRKSLETLYGTTLGSLASLSSVNVDDTIDDDDEEEEEEEEESESSTMSEQASESAADKSLASASSIAPEPTPPTTMAAASAGVGAITAETATTAAAAKKGNLREYDFIFGGSNDKRRNVFAGVSDEDMFSSSK